MSWRMGVSLHLPDRAAVDDVLESILEDDVRGADAGFEDTASLALPSCHVPATIVGEDGGICLLHLTALPLNAP
jgi:hypothetical protein